MQPCLLWQSGSLNPQKGIDFPSVVICRILPDSEKVVMEYRWHALLLSLKTGNNHNLLMKRIFLLFLIQYLSLTVTQAQKEGYNGIFGYGVGLDFNPTPPEVFIPEYSSEYDQFHSTEACAGISDKEGNLLFYTNGVSIWNKYHQIMANGREIQGNFGSTSTTQVVIVPLPKDPFLYYIFTAGNQSGPLTYSLVDMRMNDGTGDVVWKNKLIYEKTTEKLCVVKHASEEKLWLITHEFDTNVFRTFLIDENGLDTAYVASAVGEVHRKGVKDYGSGVRIYNTNAIGYLKPSLDGKTLASAVNGIMGLLEIFDFDNATGKITNPVKLFENPEKGSYGVAFSPNNSKLYHTRGESGELIQYDLHAGSPQEIINSAQLISTDVGGALQLGPDQKIYAVGIPNGEYLDLIHNPDAADSACNFEKNAVYLLGGRSDFGLPEFTQYLVYPDILHQQVCAGIETKLQLGNSEDVTKILWNFGDPASGSRNTSSDLSPSHVYQRPGIYTVQVQVEYSNRAPQTFTDYIEIFSVAVDLGKDTVLCDEAILELSAGVSEETNQYKWNDGSTSASLVVDAPGKYWVEVSNSYCTTTDSINIAYLSPPEFEIKDTVLCQGERLRIELDDRTASYSWNDGAEQGSRYIVKGGKYTVTGFNQCGSYSQEFTVTFQPALYLDLPDEISICKDEVLNLDITSPSAQYLWQDGSTNPIHQITQEGTYWVHVFNECESLSDTVKVYNVNIEDLNFPNVITPNGDDFNEFFVIDERLLGSRLTIFNRWGKEVYFAASYQNDWDGEGITPGFYYYLLQENCSQQKVKGFIQLLK